jgi:hypothetical protein
MIDQILNFYAQGKISEEAALAGIILERFGPMTDQELKTRMNDKSIRSIKRYRRALSNLSPVSKLDFNNNRLTNQQELNPISEVLSKYGKLPLLSQINAVFAKHQIKPNAAALEYIIKDILKKNQYRSFTQLLLWSIPVRWGEALVETAPKEEPQQKESVILIGGEIGDTTPERPNTDQDAEQVWQQVSPAIINQVPGVTAEMIKRMIPVHKKDSTLYLAVESDFTKEWILHKVGNLFSTAFSSICMNYEIILDQDAFIKIA